MSLRRILVLLAHPVLERSVVNRRLAEAAARESSVFVHDLYEAYPTLAIDVAREQHLLTQHDVIIFQHPLYWYSTPAILKQWQDLVLEHQWAYGSRGHHLDGKITLNVVSTGGPAEAYRTGGVNRFSVRQFLAPYEQTARLCRMRFLAPFVVHSALKAETETHLDEHAQHYVRLLQALRDDTLELHLASTPEQLPMPIEPLLRRFENAP